MKTNMVYLNTWSGRKFCPLLVSKNMNSIFSEWVYHAPQEITKCPMIEVQQLTRLQDRRIIIILMTENHAVKINNNFDSKVKGFLNMSDSGKLGSLSKELVDKIVSQSIST